ncbi:ribonuclease P protein subunit p25-like protein [Tanacetum coccineum]
MKLSAKSNSSAWVHACRIRHSLVSFSTSTSFPLFLLATDFLRPRLGFNGSRALGLEADFLFFFLVSYMAVEYQKILIVIRFVRYMVVQYQKILIVIRGQDVFVLNIGLDKEEHKMIADLLRVKTSTTPDVSEMGKYYQIATVLYEVLKMVVPPSKVETEEKGSSEIVFKAMGRAINKTVTIVELIGVKKSFKMRHQPCSVTSSTKFNGTVTLMQVTLMLSQKNKAPNCLFVGHVGWCNQDQCSD